MFDNKAVLFLALLGVSSSLFADIADPTRPLGAAGAVESGTTGEQQAIRLSSILVASERRVAIINGQPVQEQQTLKGIGAVVKKIEADAVILQQGDKVWRVSLNKTAVRK